MQIIFDKNDWKYRYTITDKFLSNNFSEYKKIKKNIFGNEEDYTIHPKNQIEQFLNSFFNKQITLKMLIKNTDVDSGFITYVFCVDFGQQKNKKNEKEKNSKKTR